ncbi:hypothetical protein [Marinobacter sp. SS21]|uniref:hypothetical protein n=1 Tax=Marinobacter sp. SS21 TaxID=2979460 RepID=UPI00232EC4D7|nr:hypothetical protein [Marinobacter sp. SS21]MDC0664119.1 hypothetical protein [Marinobacter sp. SS21]
MRVLPQLTQRGAQTLMGVLRRLDPYYRDDFDRLFRPSLERVVQRLLRRRLQDQGLDLAEEVLSEDEKPVAAAIADTMNRFLIKEYRDTGQIAERAGNTKTYGLVRGRFCVNDDLPRRLQLGVFRPGRSYPVYVRFGGPGPRVVPDIDDNGILSMGIKLMGVAGRKLLTDEKHTVDFSGISAPSFTTPNVFENIKLQREIGLGTPAWYFLNPLDPHVLDLLMQALYARTHANPLETTYYSCVPYQYGKGRAMKFRVRPRLERSSPVGKLTDNYLRDAMVATLTHGEVVFDFAMQLQTDPVSMPIEDASIVWDERQSPFIPVATLVLPPQVFDVPAQHAFARNITINPWHTLAVHRPLGNQNRARKTIYQSTSRMRQAINGEHHLEPSGDEVFVQSRHSATGRPQPAPRRDRGVVETSS